jgi:hypothetical protein
MGTAAALVTWIVRSIGTTHYISFVWFAQMYVIALSNNGANCKVHIYMTDE